jgi:hypothetical protein
MKTFTEFLQERPNDRFAAFALANQKVLKPTYWFGVQCACEDVGMLDRDVIQQGRALWAQWSDCEDDTEETVDLKRGGQVNVPPHEIKRRLPDLFLVGHDTWCWGFNIIGKLRTRKLIAAAITDYAGAPIKPGWVPFMCPSSFMWRRLPKTELLPAPFLVDKLFPGSKDPYAVYQALEDRHDRDGFEQLRGKFVK